MVRSAFLTVSLYCPEGDHVVMSASMRRYWFRALTEAAHNYKPFALADGIRAIGCSKLARTPKERLEHVALAARRFAFAERPKLIAKWCAGHYDLREPESMA